MLPYSNVVFQCYDEFKNVFLFYLYGCFTCTNICTLYEYLLPQRQKGGIRSPGTGIIDGCEPPCGWPDSALKL